SPPAGCSESSRRSTTETARRPSVPFPTRPFPADGRPASGAAPSPLPTPSAIPAAARPAAPAPWLFPPQRLRHPRPVERQHVDGPLQPHRLRHVAFPIVARLIAEIGLDREIAVRVVQLVELLGARERDGLEQPARARVT